MIALRETVCEFSRHPVVDKRRAESLDASFPVRLESKEFYAQPDHYDRNRRDQDDRHASGVAGHHSSPSRRRLTAFAMMPPRFREDMYCSVSLNACSSVIPLFLRVV